MYYDKKKNNCQQQLGWSCSKTISKTKTLPMNMQWCLWYKRKTLVLCCKTCRTLQKKHNPHLIGRSSAAVSSSGPFIMSAVNWAILKSEEMLIKLWRPFCNMCAVLEFKVCLLYIILDIWQHWHTWLICQFEFFNDSWYVQKCIIYVYLKIKH